MCVTFVVSCKSCVRRKPGEGREGGLVLYKMPVQDKAGVGMTFGFFGFVLYIEQVQ
jgi:hypothetical protein